MTMHNEAIDAAISQLKTDEGYRQYPYKDTVGKLTIGYGRNLDDVGIPVLEAEFLLQNDVLRAAEDLERSFPWATKLDPVRQAVLVNMVFNLGITRFSGFKKTLAAVERAEYEKAAAEMLDSRWAKQVGNRALRLSEAMRDGA